MQWHNIRKMEEQHKFIKASPVTCTVCTHDETGCYLPRPLVLMSVAQWGGWGDHQIVYTRIRWQYQSLWRMCAEIMWKQGYSENYEVNIVVTRPCLIILCEDHSSCFSTERLSTFKTKIPLSVKSDILTPLSNCELVSKIRAVFLLISPAPALCSSLTHDHQCRAIAQHCHCPVISGLLLVDVTIKSIL